MNRTIRSVICIAAVAAASGARGELRMEMFNQEITRSRSALDLKFNAILFSRTPTSPDPTEGFDSFNWTVMDEGTSPFVDFAADRALFDSFWRFRLGMSIVDFDRNNDGTYDGIQNLRVRLDGMHKEGPHDDDEDDNELPQKVSQSTTRPIGGNIARKVMGSKSHAVTSGGRPHRDKYSAEYEFKVGPIVDEALTLPGPAGDPNVHLRAEHLAPGETAPKETGMTAETNLFYGFNVEREQLFFSADQFHSARRQPTGSPDTDPEFASDRFLGSFMSSVSVTHLGMNDDGLHEFSGGSFFLAPDVNMGGTYDFTASFDAMYFDPAQDVLFAVLSEVEWGDERGGSGYSPFLDQFTDQHLFTAGVEGIQLVVHTDLDGLTNNFTTDYSGASTLRLTGTQTVPEPATLALAALAGVLALGRHRCRRA